MHLLVDRGELLPELPLLIGDQIALAIEPLPLASNIVGEVFVRHSCPLCRGGSCSILDGKNKGIAIFGRRKAIRGA